MRILTMFIILFLFVCNAQAKDIDIDNLIPEALALYKAYTSLEEDPDNVKKQKNYMQAFPSDYSLFLKIFDPSDFKQLYTHHEYLVKYQELTLKHPEIYVDKLLLLASKACFGADMPGYFIRILEDFMDTNPELYSKNHKEISKAAKLNIETLLKATYHNDAGIKIGCPYEKQ